MCRTASDPTVGQHQILLGPYRVASTWVCFYFILFYKKLLCFFFSIFFFSTSHRCCADVIFQFVFFYICINLFCQVLQFKSCSAYLNENKSSFSNYLANSCNYSGSPKTAPNKFRNGYKMVYYRRNFYRIMVLFDIVLHYDDDV